MKREMKEQIARWIIPDGLYVWEDGKAITIENMTDRTTIWITAKLRPGESRRYMSDRWIARLLVWLTS